MKNETLQKVEQEHVLASGRLCAVLACDGRQAIRSCCQSRHVLQLRDASTAISLLRDASTAISPVAFDAKSAIPPNHASVRTWTTALFRGLNHLRRPSKAVEEKEATTIEDSMAGADAFARSARFAAGALNC